MHGWRLSRTLSRGLLSNLDLSYADPVTGRTFLHEIFHQSKRSRLYDEWSSTWPFHRLIKYLTDNTELLQTVDLLAVDSRGYSVIALMRARGSETNWVAAVEKLFRVWQWWRSNARRSVLIHSAPVYAVAMTVRFAHLSFAASFCAQTIRGRSSHQRSGPSRVAVRMRHTVEQSQRCSA